MGRSGGDVSGCYTTRRGCKDKMSRRISPDDDGCFDCLTEDDEEDGHSKVVLGHGGRTQDGCRGKWQRRGSSQGLNATGGGRCSTTPRFVLDYGQDGLGQCKTKLESLSDKEGM
jgi:hypothetical protein